MPQIEIDRPRILLIGNGDGAKNLKELINDFNIVVRFNHGVLHLNEDVGYRTDIHVMNETNKFVKNMFLNSETHMENCCFVKTTYSSKNILDSEQVKEKLKHKTEFMIKHNIPKIFGSKEIIQQVTESSIELPVLTSMKSKGEKHPSIGMIMILFFVVNKFSCTIIGFDLLTNETFKLTNDHYFEKKHNASNEHDWSRERQIIKLLRDAKLISVLES